MRKIKRKIKKKFFWFFILVLLVVAGGFGVSYYLYNQEQIKIAHEKALLKKIKSHYNEIVKISKETKLYEKINDKYESIGTIGEGEVVSLEDIEITTDVKYFKIKELGYYVKYQDVSKEEKLVEKSDRYKKYLLFNENVVTKENSKLLRNGKVVYSVNKSIDTPIIMKDDNGYYIEYFG